jgi:hypothetical protein
MQGYSRTPQPLSAAFVASFANLLLFIWLSPGTHPTWLIVSVILAYRRVIAAKFGEMWIFVFNSVAIYNFMWAELYEIHA